MNQTIHEAVETWLEALQDPGAERDVRRDPPIAASAARALSLILSSASQDDPATTRRDVASAAEAVLSVLEAAQVVPSRVAEALTALHAAIAHAAREQDPAAAVAIAAATLNAHVAQLVSEREARDRRDVTGRLEIFSRTLSHELKNPIGAADGAAHMLLDDTVSADPAQRRRFAEMVSRNLRRALDLVNDLRALTDTEQGRSRVRTRTLTSIIEEVVHEVAPRAQEQGVTVSMMDSIPDARVDASRVTLVLMNLAWNAVKYSDPDKAERWVRIGASTADGEWRCFVADNGLGIPRDMQDRVFEPFQRAHRDHASGTGLGLSIAHEAAVQLGGRIWLDSEPGLGTTFHVAVPGGP